MFAPAVERALRASLAAHEGQVRKTLDRVPYVTHPVHVALILARLGCDDVVLQAALLHDVVEDCAGWTLARVEAEFGSAVRTVVAELTEDKSQSWEDRKRVQVESVAHLSTAALVVKAADKLHNMHTLLEELRGADDPTRVWARFRGGRERTLERSAELVDALRRRVDPRLASALGAALADLRAVAVLPAPPATS